MVKLSENDYSTLLGTFNKLQENNDEKKKQGVHDYSLINALLKKNDEVNLHSNFIYSMINPNGNHYCENKFLELFLKSIGEANFINPDNARVYKEKGKIDLLVEDGDHVLIIENKLRAVDQKYQISRYIQYVIDNYLQGNKENLGEKIHIVYLSEYKAIPSKKSESIIGFTLKEKKLKWDGKPISKEIQKKDKIKEKLNLDLPVDTQFEFNRVKHSDQLSIWITEAKKYLENKSNSESLIYAFAEYGLVLERLRNNKWRKIMSLDEYTIQLGDIEEQEKMYTFMRESSQVLNEYSGRKLYEEISRSFDKLDSIAKLKFSKDFSKDNCIKWFKKEGDKKKYRDVGFIFNYNNDEYIFLLGVNNVFLDKYYSEKEISKHKKIDNGQVDIFKVIKQFNEILKEEDK